MHRILIPEELKSGLEGFIKENSVPVEIVTEGGATLRAEKCSEPIECTSSTLYAGGWISCAMALGLASKLEVESLQFSKMMDHLDIKIRRCQLGCFD